jgi:hypothetical protein
MTWLMTWLKLGVVFEKIGLVGQASKFLLIKGYAVENSKIFLDNGDLSQSPTPASYFAQDGEKFPRFKLVSD